jgi:hypothetical protein
MLLYYINCNKLVLTYDLFFGGILTVSRVRRYGPDIFPSGSHPFIKYWKTAPASIKIKKWMKK